MEISITKTSLKEILPLRTLFLQENIIQIRFNACHERGWSDSWLISSKGVPIGYGAIKGNERIPDRDEIFEFYLQPAFRKSAAFAFEQLITVSGAKFLTCQTNEPLLSSLFFQYASSIHVESVLFGQPSVSDIVLDNVIFRKRGEDENIFEHFSEPVGDFVLEINKEVVASGGFLLHYNFPFADLYMEVKEEYRRKGFGSLLVQEIIKQCVLAGRSPAARCNTGNKASKATLQKAGFRIAGYLLVGEINKETV